MVNTRGWRLVGASMCAAGLLLAGCGDSDPAGNPSEAGPLAEFFGWDDADYRGEDREVSEEERQQHYQVQEYIVTCMQEAGFEYFPEPFWGDREDSRDLANDPWEESWKLQQEDPEAYAKQYGYGITTIEYDDSEEEWDPSDDPNWEYQESLSEAARKEYEIALWGDWEAFEEENANEDGEVEVRPGDLGGCQNEAYEEVHGWGEDDWEDEQERFQELWDEWDSLYERIENDARLVEVQQAWSACMADAGYSGLEGLWDAQEQVYERQNELYGWDDEGYGEDDFYPEDEEEPFEPDEPDPAELAELRDFELAIAWADYECKQEHDVDRVEQEVRFDHEEQFIDDHRAALEEYRDWMNEREAQG